MMMTFLLNHVHDNIPISIISWIVFVLSTLQPQQQQQQKPIGSE